jgi:hypothetical protein
MNVPVVVDHTSSGKQHFEVLDGLRGSAAFLMKYYDEPVRSWLSRRYGIKRATVMVPGQAGEAR